jgi:hypothetical protein
MTCDVLANAAKMEFRSNIYQAGQICIRLNEPWRQPSWMPSEAFTPRPTVVQFVAKTLKDDTISWRVDRVMASEFSDRAPEETDLSA